MDQERERIREDLRGLLQGEVLCDDYSLQLYASDASIYEIRPRAVVRPRSSEDVVQCVQYAAENNLPLHARGAGTGLAGESLGAGIVLDFSRSMNHIVSMDEDTVRVQPGVIHARLNEKLARRGKIFGPDPATSRVTTMGSVIAIDGSGSHWLKYGSARSHVRSLEVVLADGSKLEVSEPEFSSNGMAQSPRAQRIGREIGGIVKDHAELIATHFPKSSVNRAGYALNELGDGEEVDLTKLLVGSEGTLAVITEATLGIDPLAAHHGVALLMFGSLDGAARAAQKIVRQGPSACDLLDRRHLSLARESDVRFDLLIPPEAEAVLLVESQADSLDEVRQQLKRFIDITSGRKKGAFASRQSVDPEDVAFYWRLAQSVVPTLYRLRGSTRPLPFIEDIAVPPETVPEFLVDVQTVLKKHQVIASLFGHVGHGQLHIRPFLDLTDKEDRNRMRRVAGDLYEHVYRVGGTISGEHGDGLSRTSFLKQQYGPVYDLFREVKRIFDPHNILNPGKIISDDDSLLTQNLRTVQRANELMPQSSTDEDASPTTIDLQLNWTDEEFAYTVRSCNGCGLCRSELSDVRMCPIFRMSPREEASPRAKANLLRGVLSGQLTPESMSSNEFKEIADLCVNCHQCRQECPANVDIPHLMTEAKAAYISANGLQPREWFFTHLDFVGKWFGSMHSLSNWAFRNRQMRWIIEKLFGIAQGRKLPEFASHPYVRQAAKRRLTTPSRHEETKVVYFVDTFANYFDTQLAESFEAVLRHNRIDMFVPPGQLQSGMFMMSMGAVDRARQVAASNSAILAEAVRQGYHIVTTEPSAALCLTHDYPMLLDDDDARLVAENTSEACTYLWSLHQRGKLQLDFRPIHATVAYHMPCHMKALNVGTPGHNLLQLIPGLRVEQVEKGCSGMAGTYGMQKENYRSSLRAGLGLINRLREPSFVAGATECCTCRMQMEQGSAKPTIHPVKFLAQAYGIINDAESPLARRGRDLVLT